MDSPRLPILLVFAAALSVCTCHWDGTYSHDESFECLTSNRHWMQNLRDDVKLSELSLIGTHDSAARYGGWSVETQSLSIPDQLNCGIRVFDIRLRVSHDVLTVHHGLFYQNINFGDVLIHMTTFLSANPSETLFVRVKEEIKGELSTLSFPEAFETYYNKFRAFICNEVRYDPPIGELRGKIVFLQNFVYKRQFGMNYSNMTILDDATLNSIWDLHDKKWLPIKQRLQQANSNKGTVFVTYLSANGLAFPYFVASGHAFPETDASRLWTGNVSPVSSKYPDFPRLGCVLGVCSIFFEGTNALTNNYIHDHKLDHVGIVMADFPGLELIQTIIDLNLKHFKN